MEHAEREPGRRHAVEAWNETDVSFPERESVLGLIEAQAAATPDAPAVRFEDETLTYRELNARANQVARRLLERGVGTEGRVGICLERRPELLVAIVGTLKAGAAYVPIDPEYPAARAAWMLNDARVALAFTDTASRHLVPAAVPTVALDASFFTGESEVLTGRSGSLLDSFDLPDLPELPVNSSDLNGSQAAYVIYTSGSTGTPKGVVNTHEGLRNRLLWMQHAYRLTPRDRVLQKTTVSFDVSVWELLWPLMTGAQVVLARQGGQRDPHYLAETIARHEITALHFVPSMLRTFLNAPLEARCRSLRLAVCSGEALSADLVRAWRAQCGWAALHNLYGPTEAAIDVTAHTCGAEDESARVPIGRPIANTQVHVLDATGAPQPVGVTGELHLAGAGLARGYLGRPAWTAERFVPNALGRAGTRLYRTGDFAHWRSDGAVEYLGRADEQVKVRGFRIEPGEIAAAIRALPGVADAAVVAREDVPGHTRLVAYVVANGVPLDPGALRTQLARVLPEYMLPSPIVPLDALPLTTSGKLDRRALPPPETSRAGLPHEAPAGDCERAIAEVWRRVLRVGRVGLHDNFFDLGGNSLLFAEVRVELSALLGREIAIVDVYQYPTIALLTAYLSGSTAAGPPAAAVSPLASRAERQRQALSGARGRQTPAPVAQATPAKP